MWIFFLWPIGIIFLIAVMTYSGKHVEDSLAEERKHPILEGKELEEWTKIYQAININYQHSYLDDESIAEMTWERWGELTGRGIYV